MINQWEEFKAGPTQPLDQRMHVTLNSRSVILLSGNVHERMGKPDAVIMYFDKVNSIIGMRPDTTGQDNAFPVREKGIGRQRVVRVAPFCHNHNIRVERTTTFIDPQIDETGFLSLDLRNTTQALWRRRRNPLP